jgi:hypothetical protein
MRRTAAKRGGLGLALGSAVRLGLVLAAVASAAQAESVTLRWRHATATPAAGFRVYFGSSPAELPHRIDLGRLAPDADGIFRARVELPDGEAVYVAIAAYDAEGRESPRSRAWLREPALGTPGRPRVVEP